MLIFKEAVMSQVQLAEVKNRLSEYVKAVQTGAKFEITVRGVPVAQLIPIQKASSKKGFAMRVISRMTSPATPTFDVRTALLEGRK
jgi:prevent-host-death family protein